MRIKELPANLGPAVERILALAVRDPETGCLIWMGSTIKSGYGSIRVDGKQYLVHRIMLASVCGDQPGKVADHSCHVPSCVEPRHLRWLSHAENTANRAGANRTNGSGVRGVNRGARRRGYRARVMLNGISRAAWFSDSTYGGSDGALQAADSWAQNTRRILMPANIATQEPLPQIERADDDTPPDEQGTLS